MQQTDSFAAGKRSWRAAQEDGGAFSLAAEHSAWRDESAGSSSGFGTAAEHAAWLPPVALGRCPVEEALRSRDGERSLPLTPRSPSPTTSPTASPKRQCPEPSPAALTAATCEDDLESRAAALGLTEATQRAWRETAVPPTPPSPSPTTSVSSSPKHQRESRERASLLAAQTTAALVASLERAQTSPAHTSRFPEMLDDTSMEPPSDAEAGPAPDGTVSGESEAEGRWPQEARNDRCNRDARELKRERCGR